MYEKQIARLKKIDPSRLSIDDGVELNRSICFLECLASRHTAPAKRSGEAAGYASLLEDYRRLRKASEHIKHWHDTNNGGMIVSGEHVLELWKVLAEIQEA